MPLNEMPRLCVQDDTDTHSAGTMANFVVEKPRKVFVLCFDGTGNKFTGTDEDSNSTMLSSQTGCGRWWWWWWCADQLQS